MGVQRFSTGTEFTWHSLPHRVYRVFADSRLDITNTQTGELQHVTTSQLTQELFDGNLTFDQSQNIAASEYISLDDCPPNLREVAEFRLSIIKPLLHNNSKTITETAKQRANELGEQDHEINPTTIYRWFKIYVESGHDLRSLIPAYKQRGGAGKSRLQPEVEAIIQATIEDKFLVRELITADDILHEVAVRIDEENQHRHANEHLKLPSQRTVTRRINTLDIKKRIKAKKGRQAARKELTQFGQMTYPERPLERVEIDHTKLDIIVVDKSDSLPLGRPTITYCIDTATRFPLGFYVGFEPASYGAVMQCLLHAIQPKSDIKDHYHIENEWLAYGIPSTLVIDNGKEFIGKDLADACAALGIEIERTIVRTPWMKAAIERMFSTLNTGVLHGLPGTTFSNTNAKDDYDSTGQASITLDELDRILVIFMVDVYVQRFHSGLGGIPANKWKEATRNGFSPRLPTSSHELKILLGRIAYRVVHSYGIELHSLRYNHADLALLRLRMDKRPDRRVKVKYNPSDLSYIHVYDPFENAYIYAPAVAQEYTDNLSLWKHRVIHRRVLDEKGKVDIIALGRAKRKIQQIVDQSKDRKTSNRSKIARWETAGQATNQLPTDLEPVKEGNDDSTSSRRPDDINIELSEIDSTGWEITYG